MARLEPGEFVGTSEQQHAVPVILSFMLEEGQAKEVNLALDFINSAGGGVLSRGQALADMAKYYLTKRAGVA